MSTVYEQAAIRNYEMLLADETQSQTVCKVISHVQKMLQQPDNNSMMFGQYWRSDRCTPPHLWCYADMLSWGVMGKLVAVEISVGFEPSCDSEEEENNRKLQNLPDGISAEFFGGNGDNDGRLKWTVPLEMNIVVDGEEIARRKIAPTIYGRSAPLEVGFTTFVTSCHHLLEEGFLARWPYGSKSIYLLALDDKYRYSRLPKIPYKRRG